MTSTKTFALMALLYYSKVMIGLFLNSFCFCPVRGKMTGRQFTRDLSETSLLQFGGNRFPLTSIQYCHFQQTTISSSVQYVNICDGYSLLMRSNRLNRRTAVSTSPSVISYRPSSAGAWRHQPGARGLMGGKRVGNISTGKMTRVWNFYEMQTKMMKNQRKGCFI